MSNKFDDRFVAVQLNTIGVEQIANLVRHGYTAKSPYNLLLSQIIPHISNNLKNYMKELCEAVLNTVHCEKRSYKFGQTQVFFRSKSEHFINYLLNLDETAAKQIAKDVSEKYKIFQRHALLIKFKFVLSKSSIF